MEAAYSCDLRGVKEGNSTLHSSGPHCTNGAWGSRNQETKAHDGITKGGTAMGKKSAAFELLGGARGTRVGKGACFSPAKNVEDREKSRKKKRAVSNRAYSRGFPWLSAARKL